MAVKTQSPGRKTFLLALTSAVLGLSLSACNRSPATPENRLPQVVATSTILEDLTARVGADEIQLTGLLNPGDDPHIYEPVPLDSRTLEQADLILYNGYDLEPQIIRLMNAVGQNARRVAIGEVVSPLGSLEEGEAVPDPHVWGDAKNVVLMVEAIRDELIDLSPADREVFTQNAAQLIQELQRLDAWIIQQIQTIPPQQRQLITTHDAFQYYAQAYGLEVTGTLIGMSTEEQPSARTVQELVRSIQDSQVPAIFAETTINPQLIRTVAQEAGVQLAETELYSDSIGTPGSGADSYIRMMVSNTRAIVEALGGQYTPFEQN
ncbi:zinc ABC transporter substrate-binding protein [Desertifilum sp. FACHB-1129]|uniref:Manganese ABC transporter substrate-binding protein n=1 Tax=Desertifilum tharense IPPAS B-1220 TaxID=1781255 RepID=A0A1E5QRN9_9CYAN|nr:MULTISPECIES: zinc ABC transporter substrate-binding protein [Desertifilum]MDA0209478.1 zinc ABC transporter substrate-binding protein [Cyanobacteria bacterium FC1]MBD2315220.1 zinc ABC transporter substrate-binding protein [Desertifilum sp. FACHB-1129]MBD2324634.1 zinc ABC transporter substrate-binding protein [Desertifilum sp. FACHB-866]MBD2334725.1 zinc ABC transporter substrate-binding protein [Desertifilum sp. FACHB-868]OEJ77286.1 manganese ABC transporter substrate-binding protein [De